jgi:hypothetical protein
MKFVFQLENSMENQEYLNDGVYAEWDGYGIYIWTSDGIDDSEKIYLDPVTLNELNNFYNAKLLEE